MKGKKISGAKAILVLFLIAILLVMVVFIVKKVMEKKNIPNNGESNQTTNVNNNNNQNKQPIANTNSDQQVQKEENNIPTPKIDENGNIIESNVDIVEREIENYDEEKNFNIDGKEHRVSLVYGDLNPGDGEKLIYTRIYVDDQLVDNITSLVNKNDSTKNLKNRLEVSELTGSDNNKYIAIIFKAPTKKNDDIYLIVANLKREKITNVLLQSGTTEITVNGESNYDVASNYVEYVKDLRQTPETFEGVTYDTAGRYRITVNNNSIENKIQKGYKVDEVEFN